MNPLLIPRAELTLSTYSEWWLRVGKKTRNMIRKSQRLGVETRVVKPDETFWVGVSEIFNESPKRRGREYINYGVDPRILFSPYLTDDDLYIGAYLGEKLIGFAHLHRRGDAWRVSALQCFMSQFDKAPMNALMDKVVQTLCDLRAKRLIYGVMQTDGLGQFKQSVGFRENPTLRSIPELAEAITRRIHL